MLPSSLTLAGAEAAEYVADRGQTAAAGGSVQPAYQDGEVWTVAGRPDGLAGPGGSHGGGAPAGELEGAGPASAKCAAGAGQRQEVSGKGWDSWEVVGGGRTLGMDGYKKWVGSLGMLS